MMKISIKYKVLSIVGVLIALYSILYTLYSTSAFAQAPTCGSGTPIRNEGLVTTPQVSGKFSSSGACITSDEVIFVPFKIPTYEDLKSRYFTQANITKVEITTLPTISDQTLYHASGDLSISSLAGTGTALIFVDGNLTITGNIIHGTATTGLVFIVGGNVIIEPSVTRIDAVIISAGTIYTAGAGCLASTVLTSALTINGSLISLSEPNQIKFCRKLSLNDQPAEIINQQPKYLVILRYMLAETLQKWAEIP